MSETALSADRLVVIGRGRLIADTGTREFIESAAPSDALARLSLLGRCSLGRHRVS
jgi:ABC-2 type transport system ATP-binding protein